MKNIIKSPWSWVIIVAIGYNVWVSTCTPKGKADKQMAKLSQQFRTYREINGEWPSNLDFVQDKDLLECCGSPLIFNPDGPSIKFEFTHRTPMERFWEMILGSEIESWSIGNDYSNEE